jgi:hypothetical protein
MLWNERFRIGDGERVDESAAKPVYRSYAGDCGIELTREEWREQARIWSIYYPSTSLPPVEFTPKEQPEQTSSIWRFLMLDLKIPRPN